MRSAGIIALVVLLMIGGAISIGHASTLNATINPRTNVANVSAVSNFVAVLTYPNGSLFSQYLSGKEISYTAVATINATYLSYLDSDMQDLYNGNNSTNETQVHVVNATITYNYYLTANNTTLVVYRNLTLNMKITNILKNVSGHEIISMNWRAFKVQGELMADLNGFLHMKSGDNYLNESYNVNMDVNELGDQFWSNDMMGGMFGHFHHVYTIDFSEFNVPLSQWHRTYNAANNETIFTYNINKDVWVNETVNSSMLGNITLSYHYDPSSTIVILGKAVPTSNNSLELIPVSATSQSSSFLYLGIGVIVVIVIVAALLLVSRKKK